MFCWRPVRHPSLSGAACFPSQTLLARPLPLSSSQVSSLGFSFFISGSLLGASVPIRVSQSCNYSSSSRDDSLPLLHHLPGLTVACCFICFTPLCRRRPSCVSPAVYLVHPDVVLLFGGGAFQSLLAVIESSNLCGVHHPSSVLMSSLMPPSSGPALIGGEVDRAQQGNHSVSVEP